MMPPHIVTPVPSGPPRNMLWTVDQFHYLGDLGCFEGRRAMLIDGVIVEEGPMNPPHAIAGTKTEDLLREAQSEFEVQSNLELVHGTVPLMNAPNVTRTVMEVGQELIGDRASVLGRPLTVSDDFAEFLTRIPGCYFMLGARPEGDTPPAHHSPGFRIDEAALPVGVKVLAGAASRLAAE